MKRLGLNQNPEDKLPSDLLEELDRLADLRATRRFPSGYGAADTEGQIEYLKVSPTLQKFLNRFQNLSGTELAQALNIPELDFRCMNLSGKNIINLRSGCLDYKDLRGINLRKASIRRGVSFIGTNLSGSNLRDATFKGCDMTEAILTGADATFAIFEDTFLGAAVLQKADFTEGTFWNVDLRGAEGAGVDFCRATLNFVEANQADFRDGRFDQAFINKCDFRGAQLSSSDFQGAICNRTYFSGADFAGASVWGTEFRALRDTRMIENSDTQGVQIGPIQGWRRLISWLSFGRKSKSCYFDDARNLELTQGTSTAFWPGPFAIKHTHNANVPRKINSRTRLFFALIGVPTSIFVLIDSIKGTFS